MAAVGRGPGTRLDRLDWTGEGGQVARGEESRTRRPTASRAGMLKHVGHAVESFMFYISNKRCGDDGC